ncbi:uncharacterized protein TNCT_428671 [Trichonephila clavata]|uniref:Uncharacterized protein n=1 Tax=Trichonephila clavata TaxID=2740835 RepID=A0A8X6M2Y9_TRICU|nr:uncharacterized protein TNCT_428671 [Trichonephila clavata]
MDPQVTEARKKNPAKQAVGFYSNLFERYANHPRQQEQGYEFLTMCLLEFAKIFEPFYVKKVGDSEKSIDAEKEEQPTRQRPINLANNTKIVIKNIPAVVRMPFF